MKTILDIENDVIGLINNKSINGINVDMNDGAQQDYIKRMPSLINDAQFELATVYKKIPAKYVLSQYPVPNILPNPLYMFDIVQHTDTDITYSAVGATEYYFEVDYLADIYIEEQVNGVFQALPAPIHIQVLTKPSGYIAYKGFITPSNPLNTIQIRFSGSYVYRARYIAFYGVKHSLSADIPNFQPDNIYDMPSDFYQLMPDGVSFRGNFSSGEPFTKSKSFYWISPKRMMISYYDQGEYTINYYRYPATITDSTDTSTKLDVDDEAIECIKYHVAGHLLLDDKPNIGTTLINEYEQKAQKLNPSVEFGETEILDVTGW